MGTRVELQADCFNINVKLEASPTAAMLDRVAVYNNIYTFVHSTQKPNPVYSDLRAMVSKALIKHVSRKAKHSKTQMTKLC